MVLDHVTAVKKFLKKTANCLQPMIKLYEESNVA